jgi:hypothetical protein
VTELPPGVAFVESVSGAAPVKQASFALGVAVLRVTGVLFVPVKQPIAQDWAREQLLVVFRGPPVHE